MVTATGVDAVELPARSTAMAVSVCCPTDVRRVFQLNWYGAVASVARSVVPSRRKVTWATPEGAPEPVPLSAALAVTGTVAPRW